MWVKDNWGIKRVFRIARIEEGNKRIASNSEGGI